MSDPNHPRYSGPVRAIDRCVVGAALYKPGDVFHVHNVHLWTDDPYVPVESAPPVRHHSIRPKGGGTGQRSPEDLAKDGGFGTMGN